MRLYASAYKRDFQSNVLRSRYFRTACGKLDVPNQQGRNSISTNHNYFEHYFNWVFKLENVNSAFEIFSDVFLVFSWNVWRILLVLQIKFEKLIPKYEKYVLPRRGRRTARRINIVILFSCVCISFKRHRASVFSPSVVFLTVCLV